MGCVCCSFSSFMSLLLDAAERVTLCTVCALLTCCMLYTLITVLIIGVGIGFHYCVVQSHLDQMDNAFKSLKSESNMRSGPAMRSVERVKGRNTLEGSLVRKRRDIDSELPLTNMIENINSSINNFKNENKTTHSSHSDIKDRSLSLKKSENTSLISSPIRDKMKINKRYDQEILNNYTLRGATRPPHVLSKLFLS